MANTNRYSPEVRGRAVRLVFEHRDEYDSEWAAIRSIASKFGCSTETLRNWVRRVERDSGVRPGVTTSQQEELKELRREVRELRRANEILRKASAYFAQAELDRRPLPPRPANRQDTTNRSLDQQAHHPNDTLKPPATRI